MEQSEEEKLKRAAYQEELKMQMEMQRAKKEAEKLKFKQEEEQLERELEDQRRKLDDKHHDELVKEGKRDPNASYQKP